MHNLLKTTAIVIYSAQITTGKECDRELETLQREKQIVRPEKPFLKRPLLPIWQITVPISAVLIFAIACLNTHSMEQGRYIFDFFMSKDVIRFRTDMDKSSSNLLKNVKATDERR